jgi:hypothetical protein
VGRCVAVALTAALLGCRSPDRSEKLERLNGRIEQLGGQDAYPVVSLDLFFDGNNDPGSIAPNLDPHPGVETFERVLREIRDREDVSDVVVQIDEVIPGEWPYVNAVYVVTTARPEAVYEWAAELRPDEYVGEDDEIEPWHMRPGGGKPPGAPSVPQGHRVVTLFWD